MGPLWVGRSCQLLGFLNKDACYAPLSLTELEVERRGCVDDHLQAGNLDHLVKGIRLGDVGHNDNVELVLGLVRVGLADLARLLL